MNFQESYLDNRTHIVRLLLPYGMYPNKSIYTQDSALFISDNICFSVSPYVKDEVESDEYYSEVEWATIAEIKLYSSIMLSVDRECSYFSMYPFYSAHYLNTPDLIIDDDSMHEVSDCLTKAIQSTGRWSEAHQFMFKNIYHSSCIPTLPPICGGKEYYLCNDGFRIELQTLLFKEFDSSNHLLVRGISTLIRSAMLGRAGFTEEAAVAAFISLDASFNLILKKLQADGVQNPSSEDAAKYIAKVFYTEATNKYFDYYYEQRIKTMHPNSRFGMFPHAPIMVDDFYDLYDALLEVYNFLICGYVNPRYKEGR